MFIKLIQLKLMPIFICQKPKSASRNVSLDTQDSEIKELVDTLLDKLLPPSFPSTFITSVRSSLYLHSGV